jgi:hypothetical protein
MSQSRRGDDRVHLRLGKQHGTMRQTKYRGNGRVAANFLLNLIFYNLISQTGLRRSRYGQRENASVSSSTKVRPSVPTQA